MKFSLLLVWSGLSVLINGSTLGKKVIEVGGNETRSKGGNFTPSLARRYLVHNAGADVTFKSFQIR